MAGEIPEQDDFGRGDPVAAALALGGHPAIVKEARAYLRKQMLLAEIQAEELKDERLWRHWSLRVRHISDVLKLAFELALAFIVLAIAFALGTAIWSASQADGLVIESFNVPMEMSQKGISGPVVASKLLDRLAALQDAAISSRAASSFSNDWTSDIKVEIPETGISLGQLVRYLHNWLGHEMHLSGDLYETSQGIAVTVRIDNEPGQTFTGRTDELDKVVQQAAEAVYRRAQPYRYSIYLDEHGRSAQAATVLRADALDGRANERAWAYNGLSVLALSLNHTEEAAAYSRRAIEADPDLPNPYIGLTIAARNQGHDEEALHRAEEGVAKAEGPGVREWNPATAASTLAIWNGALQAMRGDYGAALQDTEGGAPRAGDIWVNLHAAFYAALAHDIAKARERLAGVDPAAIAAVSLNRADLLAARAQLAMALADWRQAAGELEEADRLAPSLIDMEGGGFASAGAYHVVVAGPRLAYADAMLGESAKADAILKNLPLDCYQCTRMRGNVAAAEHNWSGAADWFAKAVNQAPSLPFAYADWGAMLLAKGDPDGAIVKFAQAHEKGPHFADPLEMWGEALMAQNRCDLALAKFEEANKYAPNWGRLHLKWGEALFWLGRKDEAAKQLALAAALDLSVGETTELGKIKRHV